jgi:hypothetical protein
MPINTALAVMGEDYGFVFGEELSLGKCFRSNFTAARVSRVGTSPQHAMTTSGAPP